MKTADDKVGWVSNLNDPFQGPKKSYVKFGLMLI